MKNLFLFAFAWLALASCKASDDDEVKSVSIQLIRNATLKMNYNGKTILVDPSLSPKNSFMSFVVPNQNLNPTVDLTMPLEEITKGVDAILVTHSHLDHFDETGKTALDPSLPLFAQPFDKKVMEESPYTNITLVEDKQEYSGITITRSEGKHGPHQLEEALGKSSGYVLQAKGYPTVYIIGDCLWDESIKNTIQQYNPDIIVANTGGAEWGGEKILMDENSVVEVAQFAPNAKVIAVHMEALDHCKTKRSDVEKKAKEANVSILTPLDGETLTF